MCIGWHLLQDEGKVYQNIDYILYIYEKKKFIEVSSNFYGPAFTDGTIHIRSLHSGITIGRNINHLHDFVSFPYYLITRVLSEIILLQWMQYYCNREILILYDTIKENEENGIR